MVKGSPSLMYFDIKICLISVSYSIHFHNLFSIFDILVGGGFDPKRINDYSLTNLVVVIDLTTMLSSHNYFCQVYGYYGVVEDC